MSDTPNCATPEEIRPDPDEQREMSQVGHQTPWFAPAYGARHSLKPYPNTGTLFVHNVQWHAKHHSDPDCMALFEISGGFTVLLPIRCDPDMFTVGACCPRCGELLPAGDLRAGVEYLRMTRKAFLAANDVHPGPTATQ
jgi:hypothetical protein